jgi:hypothetical protein
MRTIEPTTREELTLVWLTSEWDRVPLPAPLDRQLIDDPDLTDRAQNKARTALLYRIRAAILKELPDEMSPVWVDVEEADLLKLYILPCFDWYLDTGGTFRLVDTAVHLAAGREFDDGQSRYLIENHLAKVDAIAPGIVGYDAASTDEVVILIAANRSGPYTIIDGTHRATALYRNYLTGTKMHWRGILVVNQAIAECKWHIESPRAQANMAQFKQAAELGVLR